MPRPESLLLLNQFWFYNITFEWPLAKYSLTLVKRKGPIVPGSSRQYERMFQVASRKSRYYLRMATRRELRSTRLQLAKEEAVLRELKRGADVGAPGSSASNIEHSEREVEQLRAKLKRIKGQMAG
jgi:hypothetical protein